MIPGEFFLLNSDIEINAGSESIEIQVTNTGDRPIQVGSHYHFFEVNSALVFDRESGRNRRLDLPSGTAARFEPGQSRKVSLIELTGNLTAFINDLEI